MKDGGPAFPLPDSQGRISDEGMTLRDWFAGMALASLEFQGRTASGVAMDAYDVADAMLKEREK